MEVHAHTHTPRKKWTNYFWEFFMLFLAVTLGFFVENMREYYVEKHRVRQYAQSLIQDLKKDTVMIQNHIRNNIKATDSLYAYLQNRSISRIRNIDLFVLSTLDRYPPYAWKRATLEQIKNSGILRYFSNDSIGDEISSYDASTHHMEEDFKSDEELANRASELRSQLIDMGYPKELWMELWKKMYVENSALQTSQFKEFALKDTIPLLTKDLTAIRIFFNEKLNIRKNLIIRDEAELSNLIKKPGY